MYFRYLCDFWLNVCLTCFFFWIHFVIFVCCFHVQLHISVILVLNKTSWYDECDDYWHNFLSFAWCLFHFLRYDFNFFAWNFDCFAFGKNFVMIIFKFSVIFAENCDHPKHCVIMWMSNKSIKPLKHSCQKTAVKNKIMQHTNNDQHDTDTCDICDIHIVH